MNIRSILSIAILLLATGCVWDANEGSSEYLPVDDSEYPYAGVPRLVIETEGFQDIRNTDVEIPAQLQVWNEKNPASKLLDLKIRGRGNSSFTMPKCSYKLKFDSKQSLFGMPSDKEWDLISNYRDKTHQRNAITYQLANTLEAPYSPRFHFVEVYVNREYKGVYLLTEHMKVSKDRINISKSDTSFFVEKTSRESEVQNDIDSVEAFIEDNRDIVFTSGEGHVFRVRSPKKPTRESVKLVQTHFNDFERYMKSENFANYPLDSLEKWINVQDFIRYYWIQEFSKNIDGAFFRSVYLTWEKGFPIQMGPVWDFDLAYGIGNKKAMSPYDFYVRNHRWYKLLFQNNAFKQEVKKYWQANKQTFANVTDSTSVFQKEIEKAVINDEKRWPVLDNQNDWPFVDTYSNYKESIDSLKAWINNRVQWITSHS